MTTTKEAQVLVKDQWVDMPFKMLKKGDIFRVYSLEFDGFISNLQGYRIFEALEDIREDHFGLHIRITRHN